MKKYELSIVHTWSMGHRLSHGYKGPCSNLHGHTYTGTFYFETDFLDSIGFARDFKELKNKIVNYIDPAYDHRTLISKYDELREHLIELPGVVLFDDNPTAENIAKTIYLDLKFDEKLKDQVKLVAVEIGETESFSASYGDHE